MFEKDIKKSLMPCGKRDLYVNLLYSAKIIVLKITQLQGPLPRLLPQQESQLELPQQQELQQERSLQQRVQEP